MRLQNTKVSIQKSVASYIPTMNKWNLKLKTMSFRNQKCEILKYKSSKAFIRSIRKTRKLILKKIKEELIKWRISPST